MRMSYGTAPQPDQTLLQSTANKAATSCILHCIPLEFENTTDPHDAPFFRGGWLLLRWLKSQDVHQSPSTLLEAAQGATCWHRTCLSMISLVLASLSG